MPSPLEVICPRCQTELDLSGLSEVPPQVRCGQCGHVFDTATTAKPSPDGSDSGSANDVSPSANGGRGRWRGEDEFGSSSDLKGLIPPGSNAEQLLPPQMGSTSPSTTVPHSNELTPSKADSSVAEPSVPESSEMSQPHMEIDSSADDSTFVLAVDKNDEPYRQRGRGFGIGAGWLVAALLGLLVLGTVSVALLFWFYGPFQLKSGPSETIVTRREKGIASSSTPLNWTDASRYAVRIGGVKVKVNRVEFGEIRARNQDNEVQTSEDDSFFQLFLTIENQKSQTFSYTSWYGNEFIVDEVARVAQLTDDQGRAYPMLVFRDALNIHGHTPQAELDRRDSLGDTLVFEIPAEVELDDVEFFRLQLPGAALQKTGSIRFEIPGEMLKDAQLGAGVLDEE